MEARAQARFEAAQAEYERKQAERQARAERTGRKPGGPDRIRPPKPPEPGLKPKDQINLTDAASRIMPTAGGGFEQAYNALAGVDQARAGLPAVPAARSERRTGRVGAGVSGVEPQAPFCA